MRTTWKQLQGYLAPVTVACSCDSVDDVRSFLDRTKHGGVPLSTVEESLNVKMCKANIVLLRLRYTVFIGVRDKERPFSEGR